MAMLFDNGQMLTGRIDEGDCAPKVGTGGAGGCQGGGASDQNECRCVWVCSITTVR